LKNSRLSEKGKQRYFGVKGRADSMLLSNEGDKSGEHKSMVCEGEGVHKSIVCGGGTSVHRSIVSTTTNATGFNISAAAPAVASVEYTDEHGSIISCCYSMIVSNKP
jgi:hypothetical protein